MQDIVKSVPFFRPSIDNSEIDAVVEVLKSGWLTTGRYTKEFEEAFSTFMNSANSLQDKNKSKVISLAVNSNTSGMLLALKALGIGKGDAVVTSPYTFTSTPMCVIHLGAEVVFCDTKEGSYNIDCNKLERILQEDAKKEHKIKAIIAVHIAGVPCDMEAIMRLAITYKVKVVEDAAHAFPSLTKQGYIGTIGDAGVFSFYATKTITTGEGGMVCTRDKEVARKIEVMRLHGMDRAAWGRYTEKNASWKYDIVEKGYKCNLPDVLSAIGVEQLKKAISFLAARKKIYELYNEGFSNIDYLLTPPTSEGNSYHLYLLRIVEERLKIDRDEFIRKLQEANIGVSVHFIPVYYFTYYKKLYPNLSEKDFPCSTAMYKGTITLPLYPSMHESEAEYVIKTVRKIGDKFYE